MANYKLQIDDFDEVNYNLIAINTPLDDYRLAYYINKNTSINLIKNKNEISINNKYGETYFTRFSFDDFENNTFWELIQNENHVIFEQTENKFDLFSNTKHLIFKKVYLLPEFKTANYFLKINNPNQTTDLQKVTTVLNAIDKISTAYSIDFDTIKNKNNLIF